MSEYIFELDNLKLIYEPMQREKIIRCRDCMRFDIESEKWCDFKHENLGQQWRTAEPNGFCAWGVLRENV